MVGPASRLTACKLSTIRLMSPSDETTSPEEIERLRAEVDALRQENEHLEKDVHRRRFPAVRSFAAGLVLLIAFILTPIGILGTWANRTVVNTDRYVETVAPLASNPDIQAAIGQRVVDELFANVDVQSYVNQVLPPKLDQFSGPITSGIRSFVQSQVNSVLASPQFAQVWANVNQLVHDQLINALKGDKSGALTVTNGNVVLDTGQLFTQVQQALVDRGLTIFQKVPLPAAADREIVLFTSPQLAKAQGIYAIAEPISAWLGFAALVLYVIAVLLAIDRRRMAIYSGIGLVIGAAVVGIGVTIGRSVYQNELPSTTSGPAALALYDTLIRFLKDEVRTVLVLGLLVIIVGLALGPSVFAKSIRSGSSRQLGRAGASAGSAWEPMAQAGAWVHQWRHALRLIVIGLGALYVIFAARSGLSLVVTLILVVIGLAIIEVLAGAAPPAVAPADGSDLPGQPVAVGTAAAVPGVPPEPTPSESTPSHPTSSDPSGDA
jgi:hypothetical protein